MYFVLGKRLEELSELTTKEINLQSKQDKDLLFDPGVRVKNHSQQVPLQAEEHNAIAPSASNESNNALSN